MEEINKEQEESLAVKTKAVLIERILFGVSLVLILLVMLFFINKKEGFHCDEIFSYGSSNSTYSNVFYSDWKIDPEKVFFDEYIMQGNIFDIIGNVKKYYIDNTEEKDRLIKEKADEQENTWRTRKEAIDYMQVTGNGDAFNFSSVYWNQISDVHPPLFYLIVNTVSSIFQNSSSKYIIFGINVVFFILTAYFMRKILIEINKKELSILTVLLYGLSIAGISTVVFLRMYMMLTFFTIVFLYLNIKIVKNDYHIDKRKIIELILTTVGGFLTQYFFCFYALLVVIIMGIIFLIKKKYKELAKYVGIFAVSAIIGILIFPMSLYHMFFGERGVGFFANELYGPRLKAFAELILNNFGANNIIGIALIILSIFVVIIVKKKENLPIFCLISIPVVCYIMIIAKIAPYVELRYIMNVLPIATIFVVMMVGSMFDNRTYEILLVAAMVIGLTGYGFITQKPSYLYEGYNKYLEVAEEHRDCDYVYVGYLLFNHIQFLPEFMTYENTMLMAQEDLWWIKDDEELKNKDEFILGVEVTAANDEQVLQTVLDYTGFDKYEVLIEPGTVSEINNKIYRIYK